MFTVEFFIRNILLGVGLAMDACAVSMANGFKEPLMSGRKAALVALSFGLFQALMPLIGYLAGSSLLSVTGRFVPWIALVLLVVIGGKMIFEGARNKRESASASALTFSGLLVQAFATSVDALSVGLTMSDYELIAALVAAAMIATETFFISLGGVYTGKKFGVRSGPKAEIIGGIILVAIGIEIFVKGFFFGNY